MVYLRSRFVADAPTASSSRKAAVGPLQAFSLLAESSSVASLTTTSYLTNAPNLTAREGSEGSEPRDHVADLSVNDYGDNAVDSEKVHKVDVEETSIESIQTTVIESASGSADESKFSQSIPPNTVGLDVELAQHEMECSEDEECEYEIQTGGTICKFFTSTKVQ